MSYILDALRRADAERERGAVPGLHAQAAAGAALAAAPHRAAGWPWGAALGAVAMLAVCAGVLWWWQSRPPAGATPASPAVAVVPAPAPAPPPPQAANPAGATTPPMAAVPGGPAAPVAQAPEGRLPPPAARAVAPPLSLPAALPRPSAAARAAAAGVPAQPNPMAVGSAEVAPVQATPPAALAKPPPTRLPTLAELPAPLRQQVPALSLGGAVHSESPAQRMVIVNGQLFHEGDRPTPALRIEQIRLRSVVFSVAGQRFEMPL